MDKIKNGTIYDTKYSGKIEVIDDLGLIDNVHKLKIKFLDTGYEDIVKLRDITSKLVSDPNNYNNPTIYESNGYGKFKIIRDLGTDKHGFRKVEIEFLTTGYRNTVFLSRVKAGAVRDPYYPSIYGVGYIGNTYTNKDHLVLYKIWHSMISRCYNENDKQYPVYGGIGITVDPRWHSFENYVNDVQQLDGYNGKLKDREGYQLDKDYLQQSIPKCNRVYSKDTCIWLPIRDNINMRTIDNKSINNFRGSYYGVYKYGDLYYVKSYANGKEISLGAYYDEIAACNVYNNFSKMINSNSTIPLLNDVPKMTPSEILQHMYTENNIIVCKKVNK